MDSQATSTNATWPYVTIPNFDIWTDTARSLTGIDLVLFAPLVKRSQRAAWGEYSVARQGWIKEAFSIQGLPDVNPGNIPKEIYSLEEDNTGDDFPDIFVPIWEQGPALTNASVVNIDLYTHPSFRRMIDEVLEVKHVLLSEVIDIKFLTQHDADRDHAGPKHPHSYAVEPVFEGFDDNANIVGFLFAVVGLQSFFSVAQDIANIALTLDPPYNTT
jgi:hypothetical protein